LPAELGMGVLLVALAGLDDVQEEHAGARPGDQRAVAGPDKASGVLLR
jgi:hypothetical protein